MKISVIIPTFNEEKVIINCLTSLDNQKSRDFEVIVVDDGSTDKTVELIESFKPKTYKLTILHRNHLGAGMARNAGVKEAKGSIVVFVDADMTFEKVFLGNLVSPIVSGHAIGTFSKEENVSNWNNIWARCWNWNLGLPDKKRLPNNYPNEQKVFRAILKSKFEKVGGFSKGGYTDDWSVSEKLGIKAINAKDAKFHHQNPDSLYEVFIQAKWSAKRKYKLGLIGSLVAIIRYSYPISFFIGLIKSILHKDFRFLLFKIVHDSGAIIGVLSFLITKEGSK